MKRMLNERYRGKQRSLFRDLVLSLVIFVTAFAGYSLLNSSTQISVLPERALAGGGGGGCFIADTQVLLEGGTTKAIQDITIGDRVIGQGGSVNTVTETFTPLLGERPLYSLNESDAFVTGGHPFLDTDGNWRAIDLTEARKDNPTLPVQQLSVGDTIVTTDGTLTIESITATAADPATQLYNVHTNNTNTFIADDFVVHNKGGGFDFNVTPQPYVVPTSTPAWTSTEENGNDIIWTQFQPGYLCSGGTATTCTIRIDNPQMSVKYSVSVTNLDTGVQIPHGQTISVPVGTQLQFQFGPYASTDIFWFGTGYSADTPYGEWRSGATIPSATCAATHLLNQPVSGGYNQTDIFGRLVVAPATRSMQLPSNLDCTQTNGRTYTCTTTSAGTSTVTFDIGSTFGRIYASYRITDEYVAFLEGIYGAETQTILDTWNTSAQTAGLTTDASGCVYAPGSSGSGFEAMHLAPVSTYLSYTPTDPPYTLTTPAFSRDYTLVVTSLENEAPEVPGVIGASGGSEGGEPLCLVGEPFTIEMSSTDAQGDAIRYLVDWDANGSVNAQAPTSGYVPSGTTQQTSRTFTSEGTESVRVRAEDENGNVSDWSDTFTFDCVDNRPPNAPIVTTASGSQCVPDQVQDVTISATHPAGKNVFYQFDIDRDGVVDGRLPESGTVAPDTPQTTTYAFPYGDYTFNAQTVDIDSNASSWATIAGTCGRSQDDCPICELGAPEVSLNITPLIVSAGQTAQLTWALGGLNSIDTCSISGTNGDTVSWGTIANTTQHSTPPITQQTTYTMTCNFINDGILSDTAVIFLTPIWEEF